MSTPHQITITITDYNAGRPSADAFIVALFPALHTPEQNRPPEEIRPCILQCAAQELKQDGTPGFWRPLPIACQTMKNAIAGACLHACLAEATWAWCQISGLPEQPETPPARRGILRNHLN